MREAGEVQTLGHCLQEPRAMDIVLNSSMQATGLYHLQA